MRLTYTPDELARLKKNGETSPEGVVYDWWVESSQGAGFAIYREPHHSDADIALAKRHLQNARDVVSLVVRVPRKTKP